MNYLFRKGTGKPLILLHGTGGDEQSLMEIAEYLDPQSTILSFRGRVVEEGMNRFFKRNGLNQFDIESLEEETDHLLEEIIRISEENDIAVSDWTMLGYSNGANIAGHLLLERDSELKKAILLHPMSLGVDTQSAALLGKKAILSFGENDPIVSEDTWQQLVHQMERRGVDVTLVKTKAGHQVTMEEIDQAKTWLYS
ncbi:alpha/beta hydrolase [Enterococcus sp. BWR-S5]|uniref:alpha/beta hydrolase n=1 Tax=Enterococcus sp. BWR-S5 TaxID=2787714 RepID=UPI001924E374|nr:alpha/beta hydrolase [Enterococcus sp. BWR-S5]MBL1227033.1 alpha/beta hydrolase [Enterococcus sp. BWR-S5]